MKTKFWNSSKVRVGGGEGEPAKKTQKEPLTIQEKRQERRVFPKSNRGKKRRVMARDICRSRKTLKKFFFVTTDSIKAYFCDDGMI